MKITFRIKLFEFIYEINFSKIFSAEHKFIYA